MNWKLSDAQTKLREVVDRALKEGPQEISVDRKESVMIIRKSTLDKMTPGGVKAFFKRAPKLDELAAVLKELDL
jgi:hypothetical protein